MGPGISILIIRLGAVGDVIRTLPALTALRRLFPEGKISWIVEEGAAAFLVGHPLLDEVIVFPRKKMTEGLRRPARLFQSFGALSELLRRIRGFDVTIDFQGLFKSGLIALLSGAKRRIGFAGRWGKELNFLFQTERIDLEDSDRSRVDMALRLVRALGEVRGLPEPVVPIPEGDREWAEETFAGKGGKGGALIVVSPGTSRRGRYKRVPPYRLAEFIDRVRSVTDHRVVVAWGGGEEGLVDEIAKYSCKGFEKAPPTSIKQLAALLAKADLLVSGDTGPMHLAAALGTPVVALFGPSPVDLNKPMGEGHVVLSKGLDCSPCRRRGCDRRECLDAILSEEIFEKAIEIVGR